MKALGAEIAVAGGARSAMRLVARSRVVGALAGLAAMLAMTTTAAAKSGPVTAFTPQTGGAYDYGIVAIGSHADQAFTLTNSGGTATAALSVSLTGSSAFTKIADTCSAASLGPAKKCSTTIRYAPTAGSTATATLTATSTKPAATASVSLNGTGGFVDVEISPTSHDFGSTSGSQTFTATNNGNLSTGSYAFSGPTDEHYSLPGNTCTGTALAPGGSCSFSVAFTPPATCAIEPALYQDSASLGTYASVTFKGAQPLCVPRLTVNPYDPAIGVVGNYGDPYWAFFGDTGSELFSLENDGDAATGVLSFSYHDSPTGDPNQWLLLDLGSCQDVTTLAVGASCTFEITFDDSDHSLCLFPGVTVATNYLTISDASYAQDGPDPGFTGSCPGVPN